MSSESIKKSVLKSSKKADYHRITRKKNCLRPIDSSSAGSYFAGQANKQELPGTAY